MPIDYTNYLKTCKWASEDEKSFQNFRRDSFYNVVIEHVGYQLGLDYLIHAIKQTPELLKYADNFIKSENIGNPVIYYYDIMQNYLSPTTCRYIKVLSDLIKLFGSLDNIDIVEIGGGYGGQCKIIHDVFKPKTYTIIDLDYAMKLAKRFLDYFNIKPIFRTVTDINVKSYDLCISNYAFSELDRSYQDFYAEKIIKLSKKGYMTCNLMGLRDREGAFTTDELKSLKENSEILPEVPKSFNNNLIFIWNHIAR